MPRPSHRRCSIPRCDVPSVVTGPNGKAAVKRYNVYRNNVTVSLIDALAAIYPAVQRITGADFFRAMARFHVRATRRPRRCCSSMAATFRPSSSAMNMRRSMPWLADVARIERAWLDAYHAADAAPLSPTALAAVAPERLADLVFTAHPATRIVRSQFAAVTIFAANRGTEPARPDRRSDTRRRVDHAPRFRGRGAAASAGRRGIPDQPDVGTPARRGRRCGAGRRTRFDLATNIAGLIEAGAFTSLTSGDA